MRSGDVSRWVNEFVEKFLRGNANEIIQYDAQGYPQKVAPPFGTMTNFNAAGDAGSVTITNGNTLTVAGDGAYISTAAAAVDTVTVRHAVTGVVGAYTYPTAVSLDDAGHVTSITGGSAPAVQWTIKFKTADETISSDNTLTRDDTLYFPMLANKKYTFRMIAYLYESSSGDFKYRHVGPAGASVVAIRRKHVVAAGTSDAVGYDTAYSAADVTMLTASSGIGYIEWRGIIHNGANAGDFEFQWAQNTSAAYNTTVYAGSFIEYKQVD